MGFEGKVHKFDAPTASELSQKIAQLNRDPNCHGILVQSPIEYAKGSSDTDVGRVFAEIDPQKDVDGLHPWNIGQLVGRNGRPMFIPCTPLGILKLLEYYQIELAGRRCAVVGRSDIVGMPMSLLLTKKNATVTLCHSQTRSIPEIISLSDLIIAAVGSPSFIKGSWIKPGATIIDVGINRTEEGGRLVGDVEYGPCSQTASAITPVPGGVGPMTVAMLVYNLYIAALSLIGITDRSYYSIRPA